MGACAKNARTNRNLVWHEKPQPYAPQMCYKKVEFFAVKLFSHLWVYVPQTHSLNEIPYDMKKPNRTHLKYATEW